MQYITSLVYIQYFEYYSSKVFQEETHEHQELMYCDSGFFRLKIGSKVLQINAGEMILVKPHTPHIFITEAEAPPNTFSIGFMGGYALQDCLYNHPISLSPSQKRELREVFRISKDLCVHEDNPLQPLKLWLDLDSPELGYIRDLIMSHYNTVLLLAIYDKLAPIYRKGLRRQDPSMVCKSIFFDICKFMQDSVESFLTLEDICGHFCLSQSTVEKMFKDQTQMGAIKYFHYLKIKRAQEMIRQGNKTFSEIAYELGFANAQDFSRKFKKISKISPTAYRNSIQNIQISEHL